MSQPGRAHRKEGGTSTVRQLRSNLTHFFSYDHTHTKLPHSWKTQALSLTNPAPSNTKTHKLAQALTSLDKEVEMVASSQDADIVQEGGEVPKVCGTVVVGGCGFYGGSRGNSSIRVNNK